MREKYLRASNKKYHIVYKTTCIITNKFYFGLHSTNNLNDGYLGSGKLLKRSVTKHGADNHKREILFQYPSRKEASDKEKEIITEEVLLNPQCLNCGPGGLGAADRSPTSEETSAKLSAASKKYIRTEEWYKKVVATRMANGGFKHSKETGEKIAAKNRGRKLTEEHKENISKGGRGQKRSPQTCLNISASLKGKNKGVSKTFSEEHKENIRLARIGKKHSEETRAKLRKPKDMSKNMKACTIDGQIIYNSVAELIDALGSGKNGRRSPNFRYVVK